MNRRNRFLFVVAVAVVAAVVVELSSRFIAQRDLLAAILNGIDAPVLAVAAFAGVIRLTLFLVIPAWLAYAGVRWLLASVRNWAKMRA
jgi:hypothetical protein